MSEILRLLNFASSRTEKSLALATVVRASGSTYRRPGARMLVAANGESVGAVSGGCLERDVIEHARCVLTDGNSRLLAYDTRLTLGCNGVVEILVERIPGVGGDVLGDLREKMARREATVLATAFVAQGGHALGSYLAHDARLPLEWRQETCAVLESGRSIRKEFDSGQVEVFFGYVSPPIRLVIVGTGYDVVPLVRIARELGWQITLVAYPGEASTFVELEGYEELIVTDPLELAAQLTPDAFTAAMVMTHHFGRDLAFLHALLPFGLPYLGLLGPRKRREQILAAIADHMEIPDAADLASLRSPAGLDIGGESPEEIALSILSEIRTVLARHTGGFLRDRQGGIHDETPAPNSSSASNDRSRLNIVCMSA